MPPSTSRKRIIVCCDGTWQNSDDGRISSKGDRPEPKLQIPSNVTRISRCFKRTCSDGVFQIIYYQSGIGSRSGFIDRLFGGAFGIGISENIREAYAFICANYVDGDEIVLLGFSRGAFTARSIGGMISDLGLLTREGMEYFYPIFKDMQNWTNEHYDDPFPTMPFTNKPKGENAASTYRERLIEKGYSRVKGNNGQGSLIRVLAIGVWDTVGSLGIPDIEFLSRLGIKRFLQYSPLEQDPTWFSRLSLRRDERPIHSNPLGKAGTGAGHIRSSASLVSPFQGKIVPNCLGNPRTSRSKWRSLTPSSVPGSHANIGGGWPDQGVANTTLAWMMDQLSSVGCEFRSDALGRAYESTVKFYTNREPESTPHRRNKMPTAWAEKTIYEQNKPIRPWSLHYIQSATGCLYDLIGSVSRAPGMYKKINPQNGRPLPEFLEDTNERIHPSVRVRLACEGLGLNDSAVWDCPALLKYWRPRRVTDQFFDPVPRTADWGPTSPRGQPGTTALPPEEAGSSAEDRATVSAEELMMLSLDPSERWVWEYIGPEIMAPPIRQMVEENMGPYEQHLLALAAGKVHVCKYAEKQDVSEFKAFHLWNFRKMMKRLHREWHHLEQKALKAGNPAQHNSGTEGQSVSEQR